MRKTIIFASLAPSTALAHPDHAHEALSLRHMLSEPDHIAMVVLAALVGGTLVWRYIAAGRKGGRK